MVLHRIDFPDVCRFSPNLAADQAFRHFCRPDVSPHISPQQEQLVSRARVHLAKAHWLGVASPAGRIQAYVYDPVGEPSGRTIGLVHGWTSEASFMAAFVEPLRQRGHQVVAFDLPAHGYSAGRSATMIDCARAMLAVAEAAGPFDTVIAHSLGGLVALLVIEGGAPLTRSIPVGRLALIASPNRLTEVTRNYGRHLGLNAPAQRGYERHLERLGRRPLSCFSAEALLNVRPVETLVIHSRDDDEVDFSNAVEIAQNAPSTTLHAVDDLGHARVLYAPPVVRVVRDFVSRD